MKTCSRWTMLCWMHCLMIRSHRMAPVINHWLRCLAVLKKNCREPASIVVLWGEYRLLHPDGYSYSQFCDYYRQWKKTMAGSFRQTHDPGEKMFIDYTGKKLQIVDPQSGEVMEVEVYVAVLGYSQLTYVEAVASQKKEDFISATQNALHFFGGVPRVLIPDNLKSAVQKADKYEAEINTAFMDFANHYGTTVLPARSRKPQDYVNKNIM